MKITQPLKFTGGKHYLAPHIVELMPRHLHYVEPFAGACAVIFARDPADPAKWWGDKGDQRGVSEVVNDLNGELTNFWQVLRDPELFPEFSRRAEATPFSELAWHQAAAMQGVTPVERAVDFFIFNRQSRSGGMKTFATLSRRRPRSKMNEQASAWLNAVAGLPAVHARLRNVVVLNRDAVKVIAGQDDQKACFYCDPPYQHETRSGDDYYGQFEMTDEQHTELLETLAQIKGTFLLSGYNSPLYADFAAREGWRFRDFDLPNNMMAAGDTKDRRTERVWMNY